jgi:hypothetical protein
MNTCYVMVLHTCMYILEKIDCVNVKLQKKHFSKTINIIALSWQKKCKDNEALSWKKFFFKSCLNIWIIISLHVLRT